MAKKRLQPRARLGRKALYVELPEELVVSLSIAAARKDLKLVAAVKQAVEMWLKDEPVV